MHIYTQIQQILYHLHLESHFKREKHWKESEITSSHGNLGSLDKLLHSNFHSKSVLRGVLLFTFMEMSEKCYADIRITARGEME